MNQGTLPAAPAPKPRSNGSQKSNRHRKSNAEKAASEQEHLSLVLTAAETAVNILRQNNLPAAIFGSLACKLYGNSRCPKDADILVLTSVSDITAEILKQLLVAAAPRLFYLKNSRDPAATYRILWFRQRPGRRETKGPCLSHSFPLPRIRWVSGLPLAPFCFILLHKLKGWADHRDAPEGFKRARQSTDAADVRRLLDIVTEMRALQAAPSWKEDLELFDAELQADSVVRVQQYCVEFPGRAKRWRSLGPPPADPKADISVALDRLNL
ncbi:hypothetical protein B0H14DRAFT_2781565 [Mycena olivaceomarginata]|nr:hypothetical protein B0H14DRAFT_2781565 [Mycena olivaceomarginata]